MAASDTDVSKRRDAATIRQRRAKVTYSYEPQHEDELALKVGEELIISGEDEEGWFQATLNGKSGVCPSNFVELLPDAVIAEDMDKSEKKASTSTSAVAESTMKELKEKLKNSSTHGMDPQSVKSQSVLSPAASSVLAASEKKDGPEDSKSEITARKVKGAGFGDIFGGGMPSIFSLRPTETGANKEKHTGPSEKKASVTNEAGSKKDPLDSHVEYAKADFDYEALNPDELSFKVGDVIRIITKECEDEGWWRGQLNGASGVFPDNFCSVIPLNEVPAPKRPMRTPSNENGGSVKKDDRSEKENHGRSSKLPLDESLEKDNLEKSTISKDSNQNEKDKVEKTHKKDDHTGGKTDNISKKDAHADPKDKVEKSSSSLKKEDAESKSKTDKSSSKSTAIPEKKPERPEKPAVKPVVGKKPVAGTSRENTPPVTEKDVKADFKTAHSSAQPDSKSKPDITEESRSRASSATTASNVRLRHPDSSDPKPATATSSAHSVLENGGVGFDSVNSSEKLVHPTASRAKGPTRRPPSQLFRPTSEEDGAALFGLNGSNGVDSTISEDMAPKDREAKADTRKTVLDIGEKSRDSVARKDSFLKQLDSALSQPKSPTPTSASRRISDLPTSSGGLEDDVKTLKEELKFLKEDFGAQIKELRDTLKLQSDKISSLEKELEKARKADK